MDRFSKFNYHSTSSIVSSITLETKKGKLEIILLANPAKK